MHITPGVTMSRECAYLSEGDRDASIQLNVICQLSELVLLLLKCFQQTADLLLCQHNSAVVLQQKRPEKTSELKLSCFCISPITAGLKRKQTQLSACLLPVEVFSHSAGRQWRPETAGWSCPPAAASARSASP